MSETKYTKMVGYLVPFQVKDGGAYNTDLKIRTNGYTNDKYLGGLSVVTDLGVDGMNISRSCSIVQFANPQWETIKNKCESYFADKDPVNWFEIDDTNAVKVMFDFAGIEDNYNKDKKKTYVNLIVRNIELVE